MRENLYFYFKLVKTSSCFLSSIHFLIISWEFCKRHLVTLGSNPVHLFLLISLQYVHFYLERFNISNSLIKDNSSVHVIFTKDYISRNLDHSFNSLFFGFLGRSRFPWKRFMWLSASKCAILCTSLSQHANSTQCTDILVFAFILIGIFSILGLHVHFLGRSDQKGVIKQKKLSFMLDSPTDSSIIAGPNSPSSSLCSC